MNIILAIVLVVLSIAFSIFISPMLLMMGVMGASDDPNARFIYKFLGIGACLIGIFVPIILFITTIFLIF